MSTEKQEVVRIKQPGRAGPALLGLVIGGLVGAGTMLLFAPQEGKKTRTEVQQGAIRLRDQTSEKVKDTITQVKSKANQIKAEVQIKAENLQHQGQDLLARQRNRFSHMIAVGKEEIQDTPEHTVV